MDVLCTDTISSTSGRRKRGLGQFIRRKADEAGHCVSSVPKPESQLMAPALIDGEPHPLLPLSPLIQATSPALPPTDVSSPCPWTWCPLHPSPPTSSARSSVPATPQFPLASAIIWAPSWHQLLGYPLLRCTWGKPWLLLFRWEGCKTHQTLHHSPLWTWLRENNWVSALQSTAVGGTGGDCGRGKRRKVGSYRNLQEKEECTLMLMTWVRIQGGWTSQKGSSLTRNHR